VSPGPVSQHVASVPMFSSLGDGVGSLPVELERQLKERGVVVRTGVGVSALRPHALGDLPLGGRHAHDHHAADAVIMPLPRTSRDDLLARARTLRSPALADVDFAERLDGHLLPLEHRGDASPARHGVLVPLRHFLPGWVTPMMVHRAHPLDRKWPHLRREGRRAASRPRREDPTTRRSDSLNGRKKLTRARARNELRVLSG